MSFRALAAVALWLPILVLPPSPSSAQPGVRSAWVELTGEGPEARAAVMQGSCPQAVIDGSSHPMRLRNPAQPDFPAVCALALPPGASSVVVEGRALPAPRRIRRIVVLGDTGCRIKDMAAQACNDSRAWPFARVARLAAARAPDLVIHVGDYYYRETPCPLEVKACAGSVYGDHWATWAAEFFDPAEPLLRAAPWVFARGNHETCGRGARGWFTLLDAAVPPAAGACPVFTEPFVARADGLNLMVIDSGDIYDRGHQPRQIAAIAAQLDRLGPALEQGQGWIVTHRPVWGLVPVLRVGPAAPLEVSLNLTEQAAVRGRPLGGVQMILSGHVHHFQAIDFGAARPAQLIVGSGGDVGETADRAAPYGGDRKLDGLPAAAFSFSRFGYYLMDKDGEDWAGTFYDLDDQPRASCRLHGRDLACVASP